MKVFSFDAISTPAEQILWTAGCNTRSIPAPGEPNVAWTRLTPVTSQWLDACRPKIVATPCTGTDHINLEACKRYGIKVLSLRDTDILPTITATAEHTIGLILALVRKIPSAVESTKRGEWERYRFMGRELQAMQVLIVGGGRVGMMVHTALTGLIDPDAGGRIGIVDRDATNRQLLSMAHDSDIVTMHVDLNETTRGMCNAKFFSAMKPGSYFVNTSRGQVVDEAALLDSLRNEHLAGAALDVVCGEPDRINPELIAFAREWPDKLLLTPHVAGCAVEAIEKAEVALSKRLVDELKGS